MMFGNVGALSIAVINTLCASEPLRSGVGPMCAVRGVEYISFYLITQNILMFTWAEEIVKNHDDEDMEDEEEEEEEARVLDGVEEESKPQYAAALEDNKSVGANSPHRPPQMTVSCFSSI